MWGALGMLMGSRARTFEAASGLMNLISVPMWVLSGVFFSSSKLPSIWHELAIMAAWTVVPFAIALKIFRWR
jgi:ABC-type multidrug transport system permease subunit